MNQFIFYLEFMMMALPSKPTAPNPDILLTTRMIGTLQARDGAAARKILEGYMEEIQKEDHSEDPLTVLRMEIHGVMSKHFQVNRL